MTASASTTTAATEPAAVTAAALELTRISAGYHKTAVLRDVSVTVPAGKIVALLGPNGAGKTTLLNTAAGLLRPSAGSVLIDGVDMTRAPAHRRVRAGLCLVPEGRGIFRGLTVRENLRMQIPAWSKNVSLDRALDVFPVLRNRLGQIAGTMSGGQQQMLALARSYLSQPHVVLLDEVSMGLAPKVVDEIFETLRELAGTGVALLVVEQYVNRAVELSDLVVLLDKGEVGFSGPAEELDLESALRGYFGIGVDAPG